MEHGDYFLIGHPLGHSLSPFIHQRLFALEGRAARYSLLDLSGEELTRQWPSFAQAGGFNVTIPHKQTVVPLLKELRGRAALYQSVNTVQVQDGAFYGYNTDAPGFLRSLQEASISLKGRVALLGCGGVAGPIAVEAALTGASIVNFVRPQSLPHAQALKTRIEQICPGAVFDILTSQDTGGTFDLLINATPVGMFPNTDALPVSKEVISRAAAVFDVIYNPVETRLCQMAAAGGSRVVGGMPMLVYQAAAAHNIWTQSTFSAQALRQLIEEACTELTRVFAE